jgi:hypothetical protein
MHVRRVRRVYRRFVKDEDGHKRREESDWTLEQFQ